jgi:hypothetical protein
VGRKQKGKTREEINMVGLLVRYEGEAGDALRRMVTSLT